MQQAGTDFVMSCMQESDNVTMARDIQQYGLKINQLWLSGYDRSLLDQYSSLMQGVYFNNSGTVPYEAIQYGNTYPGMEEYTKAMQKYEPAYTYNGVSVQGWQTAALFARGIAAAGNDLTQANVINVTNHFTDDTAGGLSTVTNWETAHTTVNYPSCSAFLKVEGKKFVPVFGNGSQVFVCLAKNSAKNPVPVPAPPGTPGA
jgi:hypothetical protein